MKYIHTFESFMNKGFVITNGKEWYAGAKNHLVFAKHHSQTNLYPTYDKAQMALLNEIPDKIVKDKKLEIEEYK
jgi:hypothetical protein